MTKIDIVSGFLGAGKTTLIKKLISQVYQNETLVIIENEFGQISIDGSFLKDSGIQVTEMSSGCICCSLVGDFAKSLQEVLDTYSPDRIVIEPSGVGKLSDVVKAIEQLDCKELLLDHVVTVVDATKCAVYSKNFGEFFNNQISSARCVLLSRTSNASSERIHKAMDLIRSLNPDANVISTPWDQLDGEALARGISSQSVLESHMEHLEHQHCCCFDHDDHHHHSHGHHHHEHHHDRHEHHHHDHGCSHSHTEDSKHHHTSESCCCCHGDEEHHHHHHEHHHADEVFGSWGCQTVSLFTRDQLLEALDCLNDQAAFGHVLRAKGVVQSIDEGWLHFDFVPGECNVRLGTPEVTGIVCVIGSKLNEDALSDVFTQ